MEKCDNAVEVHMSENSIINSIIEQEKKRPTFSHHHINSYITNLPVDPTNQELIDILKYFKTPEVFLPLYQEKEFKNGLSVEVRAEMSDDYDVIHGITYRESLYHNHDFFEMMYVYRGTCRNIIEDNETQLCEGDLLLYNLQTVHKLIMDDPEAVVFNILVGKEVFTHSVLELMANEQGVFRFYINSLYSIPGDQYMCFHLQNEKAASDVLHELIIESVQKPDFHDIVMRLDFQKLLILLARIRQTRQADKSEEESYGLNINDVLMYIQNNYKDITLQSLSDHYSYTTRSMIRFLKRYTHQNFKDIVKEYKMLTACDLLKNSSMTIDEISLQTGYTERGYFDKVFKQTFRITPFDYRNKYRQ